MDERKLVTVQLNKTLDDTIYQLSVELGVTRQDIIRSALRARMREWLGDPVFKIPNNTLIKADLKAHTDGLK